MSTLYEAVLTRVTVFLFVVAFILDARSWADYPLCDHGHHDYDIC